MRQMTRRKLSFSTSPSASSSSSRNALSADGVSSTHHTTSSSQLNLEGSSHHSRGTPERRGIRSISSSTMAAATHHPRLLLPLDISSSSSSNSSSSAVRKHTSLFPIRRSSMVVVLLLIAVSLLLVVVSGWYVVPFELVLPSSSSSSSTDTNVIQHNNHSPEGLPKQRSFPKWGVTIDEENTVGLPFAPIVDFLMTSSIYNTGRDGGGDVQLNKENENKENDNNDAVDAKYRPTEDHLDDQGSRLPETLYVIEPGGHLWISQSHRDLNRKRHVLDKLNNTERLMLIALDILKEEHDQQQQQQQERNGQLPSSPCTSSQWPYLCQTLFAAHDDGPSGSGFPFLFWYGDYTGCNYHNWVSSNATKVSIPLFTVAADLRCNYTVPFPNYYQVKSLMRTKQDWERIMQLYQEHYPWATKIPVVGWRGGLTGNIYNATTKCPRWNMVHTVQNIESQQRLVNDDTKLFDIAITKLPPRAHLFTSEIEADIGAVRGSEDVMKFVDFQKYRSILDIDGHSWSGRFASLLCFNSVVLKVDPTYVDYFYNKFSNPNMKTDPDYEAPQPWKHYIPIRADFSNLKEQAEFVLDSQNEATVLQIVQNANRWCQHTMIDHTVAIDMLNVWERYLQLLYIHDPNWNAHGWQNVKSEIMRPGGAPFRMVQLSLADYSISKNVAIVPK